MSNLKQKVTVQVHDSPTGGVAVLDTSELRIDFDVRLIKNFSRAVVTVYNLNDTTITAIMAGERYVTIKTQLHDGPEYTLIERYYLNNATDQLILPNRLVKLYCFDELKRGILEKQMNETVDKPTLRGCINQVLDAAGHTGAREFLRFPDRVDVDASLRPRYPLQGNVGKILERLGKEFRFNTYTINGGFHFMYKPDIGNVENTSLDTDPVITLKTESMRSNPVIGIGNAKIISNLDPTITPTIVIDLSQLLTISTEIEENSELGALVQDYLKNLTEYSRYQAFAVTHIGSNYADEWSTIVDALSPTKGKLMQTVGWARN